MFVLVSLLTSPLLSIKDVFLSSHNIYRYIAKPKVIVESYRKGRGERGRDMQQRAWAVFQSFSKWKVPLQLSISLEMKSDK